MIGSNFSQPLDPLRYNDPASEDLINARKEVAKLGDRQIDIRAKLMAGAAAIGMTAADSILDIGCGYPSLLLRFAEAGHVGELFGVDPNPGGFRNIPHFELKNTPEARSAVLDAKTLDEVHQYYVRRTPVKPDNYSDLRLFKGDANHIPLTSDSVVFAISELSFYHVAPGDQLAAFDEIKRVLLPNGVLALSTSGADYKKGMRTKQKQIAPALSLIMNQTVRPAESLHAPFTSERAAEVITAKFRHVYRMLVDTPLYIDDEADKQIVLEAYRTLRTTYVSEDGSVPSAAQFEDALDALVVFEWERNAEQRRATTDRLVQTLDFASDQELDLPAKDFTKLQ